MEEKSTEKKRNWWVIGPVILYLLSKGKVLLAVLKFSKIGAMMLSMFVTIGAYAIVFPFQFAVGLVIMILIHEMGHVLAAKRKGLPVTAPLFIPFLGALITMKKNPRDAATEAYIALGGPLLGTVGALAAFLLGLALDSQILLVIANIGFFLNLINLLPIHPLDGGRISTAVTRWLWLVGLIGGLFVIYYLGNLIFFIIWAMFAWDLYQKYVRNKGGGKKRSQLAKILVPLTYLESIGAWIPGEDHKRDLPIETYSTLDGEQKVRIRWDALGVDETVTVAMGAQALIRKVSVLKTAKNMPEHPGQLAVFCEIEYEVYEADNYYEVPAATRWKFGLAYAGLAAFLIWMVFAVDNQGIPSAGKRIAAPASVNNAVIGIPIEKVEPKRWPIG